MVVVQNVTPVVKKCVVVFLINIGSTETRTKTKVKFGIIKNFNYLQEPLNSWVIEDYL